MDITHLKKTLNTLHASLKATDRVDPELQSLLQALDDDIHQLLGKNESSATEAAKLMERTRSAAAEFAAQHPQIELILRELADMLGKMGI